MFNVNSFNADHAAKSFAKRMMNPRGGGTTLDHRGNASRLASHARGRLATRVSRTLNVEPATFNV